MKILNLTINQMENPVGFDVRKSRIQWTVDEEIRFQEVCIQKEEEIIFRQDVNPSLNYVDIQIEFDELTKYTYSVKVNDIEKTNYFITPKYSDWKAKWVTPVHSDSSILLKNIEIQKEIKNAYISIIGLGLYEAYCNDEFVNQEYLMPGYHCYQDYLQYQTYDIKRFLKQGINECKFYLGNGWYKGRLGFDGGFYNTYGNQLALLFEIKVEYMDQSIDEFYSDDSMICINSPIRDNGIYDGEIYDVNVVSKKYPVSYLEMDQERLIPRISLPIVEKEVVYPKKVIISPKGEKILDFGQNLTGWVNCKVKGNLQLKFSEILQDGCFYNENYRTANFGYSYIGDGIEKWIRPHFTFYAFRYVLVETEDEIDLNNYYASVIYSDLKQTGWIQTGNDKVNQLISNALWSQKDNFLDVPTDCPQRDERLGWTGDAQIFSGTALYNMDCINFYKKFMYDMLMEQKKEEGGVPSIVPMIRGKVENFGGPKDTPVQRIQGIISFMDSKNSSPWADASTIIPWNTYLFSGNKNILKEMYPNMKLWADYVIKNEGNNHNEPFPGMGSTKEHIPYLFDTGFHFADWLALDTLDGSPLGKTDPVYVASVYYYNTVMLVSNAAKELGYEESQYYLEHAKKVRETIRNHYLNDGIVNVDTQTGYVIAVQFGILNEDEIQKNVDQLALKIQQNNGKLETGFVGTPYLCPTLSRYGYTPLAYDLLLNEEYPGWLYEVNLGATTIWERWNSVMPDGHMNPEGMNSLNHYSYGAIVEWLYKEVAGLNVLEPGFKKVIIAPKVDQRLGSIDMRYKSVSGEYRVKWYYTDQLKLEVDVPIGCEAIIVLPISKEEINVQAGHYTYTE